jgi:hypothetical protein
VKLAELDCYFLEFIFEESGVHVLGERLFARVYALVTLSVSFHCDALVEICKAFQFVEGQLRV